MVRRILIAGALLVVGLPAAVVVLALVLANTDWGRGRIVAAVETATADGPVRFRVGGLAGPLPGRIVLTDLRLSDRAGEFAVLDRVELAWSPLALLGGRLSVQAVEVTGGRVERAPDLPPDPTAEPSPPTPPTLEFPAPPVTVAVDSLRIAGLEIGAALAGRPATLTADLGARVTGEAATAAGWIEAASTEGAARVDLDLAVVPEDGTLRAEIRATEPAGGMVAGLAGLADRAPLDLRLTGSGTLDDWRGRLAGGFGANAAVDLTLSVAGTGAGAGIRVTVDGSATTQQLLPAVLQPLAGRSAELGATVRIGDDGDIVIERLALQAAAGSLNGTARIDVTGVPVAAEVVLALPDLAMLSDLAALELAGAGEARLDLTQAGRHARVTLTGASSVEGIELDGLRLELTASADAALAGLPGTVAWSLDGSVATPEGLAAPDLVALLGPRIALQAAGTAGTDGLRAEVDRLSVVTEGALLDASATLADGRRIRSQGTLALTDLQRLSGLAGRPLAGSAALAFDGTVLLDPLDVSAVLDLGVADLDLGDPAIAGLVGDSPTLSAGITLDAGNRLTVHGLQLQAAALSAEGEAGIDLAGGGLDGRVDLSAPDLAAVGRALSIQLAGAARAAVALGGTIASPTASASWRVAPLVVQGTRISALTGSATAAGLPASPAGRLEMQATVGGEVVSLGAGYGLADEALRIDGLALDGAGMTLRGDLAVNLGAPSAVGRLTMAAEDLGRVGAAAGLPLSGGSLQAEVDLASGNGQSAVLTGRLTGLALDGGATRIASVDLTGDGRGLLSKPAGNLRATVGGVSRDGAVVLETATLTVASDGTDARAELTLQGEAGRAYSMTASASAALGASPLRASIDSLHAEVGDVRIALSQPTRITLGREPRVDDLSLTVDGGRVTGGGRVDPEDLDVTLAVRDLPAELARLADPTLQLSGGIDADLSASGPLGNPAARLSVSVPALRSTDPTLTDVPPLRASAEVLIKDGKLTASADASVGDGVELAVRASAGLSPGVAGAPPRLDETGPIQASLDAEAALDRLSAFAPLAGGRLAGQASVHLVVTGTAAKPLVSGTAGLRDGEVDQPAVGLYLRDLTIDAGGRGERLVIETLSATAVGGGTLEGSGDISFDVTEGAPADMRLVARRLRAVDTDDAEIDLDADLSFQGALPTYRLSGTVTVLPSEIRIPDQLPASVVELEVTEVRDGVVVRTPEQPEAGPGQGGAPVVLDIAVAIPGQVFIRGRGLDSEWGGELAVTGHLDAPAVNGALQVRRGQLGALGRTFRFDRGRVAFDGGPPDNPALDMVLATEVADINAMVRVSGRAQDPEIDLSSEPTLPEEEVLSRILFGSPRAQLSPLQALKLAQSTAVLSGRLGSSGITDRVREALGVDTLNIDAGDDGTSSRGASLSVGKYIAPGVFLKLQQGLSGASSKAVVEVELTDNISAETDVGADSQSRVGVNWKLDY
ncbi:translocation/assembly module TamB domain-containing protein [Thalassobaculum sp.]|uniref:translocation/assembly module TamB domain-containing protein n=1 Tax=Thalassobaculum sp. TaxID=2022740 RepID=UPI0032EFC2A9